MDKIRAGVITTFEYSLNDYIENKKMPEDGQYLSRIISQDREKIVSILEKYFEIVDGGNLFSIVPAEAVAKKFLCEDIDLLIVVSQMWSGDKPLFRLLEKLGNIPVLYWCYVPTQKLPEHMLLPELYRIGGPVGSMQNAALLTRTGKKRSVIIGAPDDPDLEREMEDYARAYSVLKGLKGLRVGHVCGRYEEMTGTYIDEFKCLTKLGIEYVPITLSMVKDVAEKITPEDIAKESEAIKRKCSEVLVADEDLEKALRASISMKLIADKYELGAMTIQDFDEELIEYFGTRPQLWMPGLTEKGKTISAEGDLLAAVCMWISRHLGETTPMYMEMFSYDTERNGVLCGHAAPMDTALAGDNPIRLIPDAEMAPLCECNGAWTSFTGKRGHVVINGMFTKGDTYAFAMFEGDAESLPILDVHPSVFVKLKKSVKQLYKELMYLGMNQHFGLSYDDIANRWRVFAEISGFELNEF